MLIVLGLILSQFWTDILWYQQLGFLQVYRTEQLTRLVLFILGAVLMAVAVGSSLMIGYRSRPIYAPVSVEQAGLDRYRESVEPLRKVVSVAVPLVLGLFAGSAAAQQWQTVLLWMNRVPFGKSDPQFHMDVGFFVFTLPWLQFLVGFLTAIVFLAGLAAVVTHYLYGGLRLQGQGPRLTSTARIHLSSLASAFLLLRGIDYWLGRFALSVKDSSLITGLTYTDANAVLTARSILAVIALIVAVLFLLMAIVDRGRLIPLYGVALLVACAIVIGGIYPAAVQRFQVTPNAQRLESTYIQRNIMATRDAYGLSKIKQNNFTAKVIADPNALRADAETIPGIRLLDPALISDTYRQLQQIKQYYSFSDSLDVDRYTIKDQSRDAVVALRELDIDAAPAAQRNWVNDHLVYTHGFGIVAAYGNERTTDGKPNFFQQGIPSAGALGEYQPRVYFGEQSPDYSIVGAPQGKAPQELDYPTDAGSGQQNNTYDGKGGISIGSPIRKLLYAVKFREGNILLSSSINQSSKILYDRKPRDRVEKVAPFLTLDGDPYPAVVDGRVKWILDGYTSSSHYPYSRTQVLEDATSDSITARSASVVPLENRRINYIRNSVKATVDAYDGTVTLYTWDDADPVLRAWRKIFPGAVRPLKEIDGQLMAHLRYPEDLFKVQRDLLQRYHVTKSDAFFSQQDFWEVPDDPTDNNPPASLQPPYYLSLKMPDQDDPAFSLTSTFIPAGRTRNVLTGFLTADADAGNVGGKVKEGYGELRLLTLPKEPVVPGPGQVQNIFNSDPNVSQQLNILARGGTTTVLRGNLLTLPLGDGLLYVQPVYVQSAGSGSYPVLQKVLVAFGDQQVGYADNLEDALDQVFGTPSGGRPTQPPPGEGDGSEGGGGQISAADQRVADALAAAAKALKASSDALKAGDFAAYGQAQKALQQAVQEAQDAQEEAARARAGASARATPSAASATPAASASPS